MTGLGESTEVGRMAERTEEKNRRRRRRASARWLLFAIMALGCLLSFWAHPPSLLQLVLPAVAAAAPLLGVLSGGPERMLAEGTLVEENEKIIYVVVNRKEVWWEQNISGFKNYLLRDRKYLVSERNNSFGEMSPQHVKQADKDDSSFKNGDVSYYVRIMGKTDSESWGFVEEGSRIIVATDEESTIDVVRRAAIPTENIVFNVFPLTDEGTRYSTKNLWPVKVTDMFTFEGSKLTLGENNKDCWQKYIEAETVTYAPLALVIEYQKEGGQIVTSHGEEFLKVAADDVDELKKAWKTVKSRNKEATDSTTEWYQMLVGGVVFVSGDRDQALLNAALAGPSPSLDSAMEVDSSTVSMRSESMDAQNTIKYFPAQAKGLGKVVEPRNVSQDPNTHNTFLRKHILNDDGGIFVKTDAGYYDVEKSDAFETRNPWMRKRTQANPDLAKLQSYRREFQKPMSSDTYVVIEVDGKKMFVVNPLKIAVVPMYSMKAAVGAEGCCRP
eukprot:GHVS01107545.1.p1 GENE.GHVS01107545.1~~GHVS01107545.1.p1  ORF type:complete len:499 (-),score=67.68 GHVS01107545.1:77-1573(-)